VAAYDLILREIRRVSGISEARTGQAGQYQTTGTALQNKTQSDFATQDRSRFFESFLERTLSTIANLIKIRISSLSELAAEGDAYATSLLESERTRLGDEVVDILTSGESMLSDYGVSVRLGQSVDTINQQIDMMADLMVQQKTAPDLALMNAEIKMRRTPAEKLEVIRRSVARMQAQAAAEQQAMQEQAMQQQQQQQPASGPQPGAQAG
jgi:hypothetical protein